MPGRRSFLITCGTLATAPAVAAVLPPWLSGMQERPRPADSLSQLALATATPAAPENLVLRIDGWDTPGDAEGPLDGQVWIRVNLSWRAGWR
jgi:hypothetical protein